MKALDELINTTDPGWPLVTEWINLASNKVEILPADEARAAEALFKTQVTSRSPMGAIIYMTGGILIDDGWIRILGSGSQRLNRSLPDWNKGKSFAEFGETPSFLLIADDAIGGFYILNGGAFGEDLGKVYYFAPDSLGLEPLDVSYTEFLEFCFQNDLEEFYRGYRWKDWRAEVSTLAGDKVFNFFPPLFTKEGKDIDTVSKKAISVEEQYALNLDMRNQLSND